MHFYIYLNIDIMLDGEVVVCEERVLYVVPGIEAPLVLLLVYYAFNMEYPALG